jgi:hypothetical protein
LLAISVHAPKYKNNKKKLYEKCFEKDFDFYNQVDVETFYKGTFYKGNVACH